MPLPTPHPQQAAQQRSDAGHLLAPAWYRGDVLRTLRPGGVQPGAQLHSEALGAVARGGGRASQGRRVRLHLGGGDGQCKQSVISVVSVDVFSVISL